MALAGPGGYSGHLVGSPGPKKARKVSPLRSPGDVVLSYVFVCMSSMSQKKHIPDLSVEDMRKMNVVCEKEKPVYRFVLSDEDIPY